MTKKLQKSIRTLGANVWIAEQFAIEKCHIVFHWPLLWERVNAGMNMKL